MYYFKCSHTFSFFYDLQVYITTSDECGLFGPQLQYFLKPFKWKMKKKCITVACISQYLCTDTILLCRCIRIRVLQTWLHRGASRRFLVHTAWSWGLFWLLGAGRRKHVPLDFKWSKSERKYHCQRVRAGMPHPWNTGALLWAESRERSGKKAVADGTLLCVAVSWQPSRTKEGISESDPLGPL